MPAPQRLQTIYTSSPVLANQMAASSRLFMHLTKEFSKPAEAGWTDPKFIDRFRKAIFDDPLNPDAVAFEWGGGGWEGC
jgi:hypothetical protein